MTYHFIGIGGIGMSALAHILLEKGQKVQGSDVKSSDFIKELEKKGAKIYIGHHADNIKEAHTIVYSSAVTDENPEIKQAESMQLDLWHRSDLLKHLMKDQKCLMVTGSHGKTTTSALLSYTLCEAGLDPSYAIGGKIQKQQNARYGKEKIFVAEGDESDGSFLKADPYGAIVTSFDLDHMDFWKSEKKLKKAFQTFYQKVQKDFFWCYEDENLRKFGFEGICYGFQKQCDLRAKNVHTKELHSFFDVCFEGKTYENIELTLIGEHNILNALASFGLALKMGASEKEIRKAFSSFKGVHRRLEKKGCVMGIDVFDDYAHHPTEIKKTLQTMKNHFAPRRIVVLFEPHRYSRFKNLYNNFLNAFDDADVLFVTDIYGAFEEKQEVTSSDFAKQLGAKYIPKNCWQDLPKYLLPHDVLITLGAGEAYRIGDELLNQDQRHFNRLKIALLFGGVSSEHEISLSSSRYIFRGLQQDFYEINEIGITKSGKWIFSEDVYTLLKDNKYEEPASKVSLPILKKLQEMDVIVPIFHGPGGEDGTVQGFLETLGLTFTGGNSASLSLSMNKAHAKVLARSLGILTAPFIAVFKPEFEENSEEILTKIQENLSFPAWVKGCHLGSSLGIKRVVHVEELKEALSFVFSRDTHLIVEQEILKRQIEVAILGDEVLDPGEIVSEGRFHDYQGKYSLTAGTPSLAYAPLSSTQREEVMKMALNLYRKTRLRGFARIDFFLDEENCFWFNEINPIPGLTPTSLFPMICERANLKEKDVLNKLVIFALHATRKNR